MFFFDYIYYLLCKFYLLFKEDRDDGSWGGSAIIGVAGLCMLFFISIGFIIDYLCGRDIVYPSTILGVYFLFLIIFIIRYNRITNYSDIKDKVLDMNKQKKVVLNVLTIIFLIISIPIAFIMAIYLGSINNP